LSHNFSCEAFFLRESRQANIQGEKPLP
jgi:hypothetical protein